LNRLNAIEQRLERLEAHITTTTTGANP
jgi:hypothetical protein